MRYAHPLTVVLLYCTKHTLCGPGTADQAQRVCVCQLRLCPRPTQTFDCCPLWLPDVMVPTQAVYVRLPITTRDACTSAGADFTGAMHAACHALLNVVPRFIVCSTKVRGALRPGPAAQPLSAAVHGWPCPCRLRCHLWGARPLTQRSTRRHSRHHAIVPDMPVVVIQAAQRPTACHDGWLRRCANAACPVLLDWEPQPSGASKRSSGAVLCLCCGLLRQDLGAECANPYSTRFRVERLLLYDRHRGGMGISLQVHGAERCAACTARTMHGRPCRTTCPTHGHVFCSFAHQ